MSTGPYLPYKYEAAAWMCDYNDPVHVFRPEVVGVYRRGEARAAAHAAAMVAVLDVATRLRTRRLLDECESENDDDPEGWDTDPSHKAQARLKLFVLEREFDDAVDTLISFELGQESPTKRQRRQPPKVKKPRSRKKAT